MIIKTERLILKPISESSLPIYKEILGSDDLCRYLPKGSAYNQDEIYAHLTQRIGHWKHGFGSYGIYMQEKSNSIIGYAGVEYCPNPKYSDIRYAMSLTEQGRGYVKEAGIAVLKKTFELGLHEKIYGISYIDNLASMAIFKKLNMLPEPDIHPYGHHDGLLTFSISKHAI